MASRYKLEPEIIEKLAEAAYFSSERYLMQKYKLDTEIVEKMAETAYFAFWHPEQIMPGWGELHQEVRKRWISAAVALIINYEESPHRERTARTKLLIDETGG